MCYLFEIIECILVSIVICNKILPEKLLCIEITFLN